MFFDQLTIDFNGFLMVFRFFRTMVNDGLENPKLQKVRKFNLRQKVFSQHRRENHCSQFFQDPESYGKGTNKDLIFQEIGTKSKFSVENIENFNDFDETIDISNDFEETIKNFNGFQETIENFQWFWRTQSPLNVFWYADH